jgi:hypothetical protein
MRCGSARFGEVPTLPLVRAPTETYSLCSVARRKRNYNDSMELSYSSEAVSFAATQELANIYGTRRFVTVFTKTFHPVPILNQIRLSKGSVQVRGRL